MALAHASTNTHNRSISGSHPRRSQQDRSRATQAALLDATVQCLVEDGLSRTTTTAVAQRAGVSLGALVHHFPTKADLLAAAVGHVMHLRIGEFQDAMDSLDPADDLIESSVDALWSIFCGDAFVAWVELWVGARTDPELRVSMARVEWEFLEAAETVFADLFAGHEAFANPMFREVGLPTVFSVLGGLALTNMVEGVRPLPDAKVRHAFTSMVRAALETGIGTENMR